MVLYSSKGWFLRVNGDARVPKGKTALPGKRAPFGVGNETKIL